jgi:hypothetical protein
MHVDSYDQAVRLKSQLIDELAAAALSVHSIGIRHRAAGYKLSVTCEDFGTAREVTRIADELCPSVVDVNVADIRQVSGP